MTAGRAPRRKIILIGGSVRSGKSAFALALARRLGPRRGFLATAPPLDAEMCQRIAHHRAQRGDDFTAVEEPTEVSAALRRMADTDVVVIDCVTLWLSNLLVGEVPEPAIVARVDELAATLKAVSFHVVLVTNEVGMGVHPEHALGRAFRDVAGRAHQRLARCADEIYLAALGVIIRLHPRPVEVQPFDDHP